MRGLINIFFLWLLFSVLMLMLRLGITKQISRDTWSQLLEFARVRYKMDYYILHHYFKIKCLRFIYTCICNQYPFQLHFYLLKLVKYDMHCAASLHPPFKIKKKKKKLF